VRTALAIAWLAGCSPVPATQVIVEIDAEPFFERLTTALRLEIWDQERARTEITVSLADTDFPVRLPLAPRGGDATRTFEVMATAGDAAGTVLGRTRVLGGYVEHELRTIALVLEESCAGVECGPSERCVGGACADACDRGPARLPAACAAACDRDGDCPGGACRAGACALLASCEELQEIGFAETEAYAIDLDGAGARAPELVQCDMTTDLGGWMLVARSAGSEANADFGWGGRTGDLLDASAAYSLGIATTPATFSEILFGDANGSELAERGYVVFVGPDFVTAQAAGTIAVRDGLRTVLGACEPQGEGFMFSNAGYTADDGYYFFRDNEMREPWGLTPAGYNSSDPTCDRSGELDGRHGVLFVR
jgi:hypothetical protein